MPDLLSELPTLVCAELARRGETRKDLAAEVGTYPSTITRLLQHKGTCDAATFLRLCDWLRLDPLIIGDEQWIAAYQRGRDDAAVELQLALQGGCDD